MARLYGFTDARRTALVPAEAERGQRMADMAEEDKTTPTDIARWMNNEGFTGAGGGPWAGNTVKRWLLNPNIAGLALVDGELIDTGLARVVQPEQYRRLVALFPEPTERVAPYEYTLSDNLSTCGECGHALTGARANSTKPGYRCSPEDRPGVPGGCGKVRITAHKLEPYVATRVVAELARPGAQARLLKARTKLERQAADLEKQVEHWEERTKRLRRVYLDQGLTDTEYKLGKAEATQNTRHLKRQLKSVQAAALVPIAGVEDLVAWWNGTSSATQRAMCVLLLEKVEVFQASARGVREIEPGRVVLHWRMRTAKA